jgi:hypothetical protein
MNWDWKINKIIDRFNKMSREEYLKRKRSYDLMESSRVSEK